MALRTFLKEGNQSGAGGWFTSFGKYLRDQLGSRVVDVAAQASPIPDETTNRVNTSEQSASPAYAILDILLNKSYGLGLYITDNDIDLQSFKDAYDIEVDTSSAQSGTYETTCRGAIDGAKSFKQLIDPFLVTAKANLTVLNGKITIIPNRYLGTDAATKLSVKTFDEGNIINGIQDISFAPSNQVYNRVTASAPVSNILNNENYSLTVEDANALAEDNGQKSEKIVALPVASVQLDDNGEPTDGSKEVMDEICRVILRRSRLFVIGKFDIDYWDNTTLAPGDVINISSERYNLTGANTILAKVTKILFKKNGILTVEWSQYSNLIYDVTQTDITSVTRGAFPPQDFKAPDTFSVTGATGLAGYSQALVRVYKKQSTEPTDAPTAIATYTFNTATVEFPSSATVSNGWHTTVDAATGTGTLYARLATVVSRGATDDVAINEWSGVNEVTSTGVDGEDGINSVPAVYYLRTETDAAPTVLPQAQATFTFNTGALTPTPNSSWTTLGTLTGTGKYLWATTATAASRTSSDTIESSEWSAPILIAENGKDGADGIFSQRVYKNSVDRPSIAGGSFDRTARIFTPPNTWSITPTTGDPQRWFSETAVDLGQELTKEKTTLTFNNLTGGTSTAAIAQVNTTLYNSGTSGSDSGSTLIAEEGYLDIDGDFPAANYPVTRDSLKATFSTGSETEFTFDNFEKDQSYTINLSGFAFPISGTNYASAKGTEAPLGFTAGVSTKVVGVFAGTSTSGSRRYDEVVYSTDAGTYNLSYTSKTVSSMSALALEAAVAFQAISTSGTAILGHVTSNTTPITVTRSVNVSSSGNSIVFEHIASEIFDDVTQGSNQGTSTSTVSNTAGVYRPTHQRYEATLSGITFPISGTTATSMHGVNTTVADGAGVPTIIVGITSSGVNFRVNQITYFSAINYMAFYSTTATSEEDLVSQAVTAYQALPITGVGTVNVPDTQVPKSENYDISRSVDFSGTGNKLTVTYLESGSFADATISAGGSSTSTIKNLSEIPEPRDAHFILNLQLYPSSFSDSTQLQMGINQGLFSSPISQILVARTSNSTIRTDQLTHNAGVVIVYFSSLDSSSSDEAVAAAAAAAFQSLSTSGETLPHYLIADSSTVDVSRVGTISATGNEITFTYATAGTKTAVTILSNSSATSTVENFSYVAPITLPDYSTTALVAAGIVEQGYTGVTLTRDNSFDVGNNPLGAGDERIKFVYDTLGVQTDVTAASFVVVQSDEGTLTLEGVGIVTQGGGITHVGDVVQISNVDTANGHSASIASTTLANSITGDTVRDALRALWNGFGGFTEDITTSGVILETSNNAGDEADPLLTHTPGTGSTLVISSSVTTDGVDGFTSDTNTLTINIDGVDYLIPFTPGENATAQALTVDTYLEGQSAVTSAYTIDNDTGQVIIEGIAEERKDDITVSLDSGKPAQTATTPTRFIKDGVGAAIVWSTPEKDGINGATPVIVEVDIGPDQFISQLPTGFYPTTSHTVKATFYHGEATPTVVTSVDTISVSQGGTLTPTTGDSTSTAVVIDNANFTYDVDYTVVGDNLRVDVLVKTTGGVGIATGTKTLALVKLGPDGAIGPRTINGTVYYSVAQSSAPGTPTATAYNFTSREFSSLTTNWSKDPTTIVASQINTYYQSTYEIVEATFGGTYTITFGTPSELVSFTNVVTQTLTASQFIKAGTLVVNSDATVQSGKGVYLNGNGDFTAGNSTNSIIWDDSEGTFTVNGTIIAAGNILLDDISLVGAADGTLKVGSIYSTQVVDTGSTTLSLNLDGTEGASSQFGIAGDGTNAGGHTLTATGNITVDISAVGGAGGGSQFGAAGDGGNGGSISLTSTQGNILITSLNVSGGAGGSGAAAGSAGSGGFVTLSAVNGCVSGTATGASSINLSHSIGNLCRG